MERFRNCLRDPKFYGPALLWAVVIVLFRLSGWLTGYEDPRMMLTWAENVAMLVAMALSVFVLSTSVQDHLFLQHKTWEDLWNEGYEVAVSVMFLGSRVFAGIVASAVISPF